MIAIREEPFGRLGDDYSGSLLLPFYHSLYFRNLGKAKSAQQLAIEHCRLLNIRDLDLEVMNRMLELVLQGRTKRFLLRIKAWPNYETEDLLLGLGVDIGCRFSL